LLTSVIELEASKIDPRDLVERILLRASFAEPGRSTRRLSPQPAPGRFHRTDVKTSRASKYPARSNVERLLGIVSGSYVLVRIEYLVEPSSSAISLWRADRTVPTKVRIPYRSASQVSLKSAMTADWPASKEQKQVAGADREYPRDQIRG